MRFLARDIGFASAWACVLDLVPGSQLVPPNQFVESLEARGREFQGESLAPSYFDWTLSESRSADLVVGPHILFPCRRCCYTLHDLSALGFAIPVGFP